MKDITNEILNGYNRKTLQQLAKENGIKANLKSSVIIELLLEIYNGVPSNSSKFEKSHNNSSSDMPNIVFESNVSENRIIPDKNADFYENDPTMTDDPHLDVYQDTFNQKYSIKKDASQDEFSQELMINPQIDQIDEKLANDLEKKKNLENQIKNTNHIKITSNSQYTSENETSQIINNLRSEENNERSLKSQMSLTPRSKYKSKLLKETRQKAKMMMKMNMNALSSNISYDNPTLNHSIPSSVNVYSRLTNGTRESGTQNIYSSLTGGGKYGRLTGTCNMGKDQREDSENDIEGNLSKNNTYEPLDSVSNSTKEFQPSKLRKNEKSRFIRPLSSHTLHRQTLQQTSNKRSGIMSKPMYGSKNLSQSTSLSSSNTSNNHIKSKTNSNPLSNPQFHANSGINNHHEPTKITSHSSSNVPRITNRDISKQTPSSTLPITSIKRQLPSTSYLKNNISIHYTNSGTSTNTNNTTFTDNASVGNKYIPSTSTQTIHRPVQVKNNTFETNTTNSSLKLTQSHSTACSSKTTSISALSFSLAFSDQPTLVHDLHDSSSIPVESGRDKLKGKSIEKQKKRHLERHKERRKERNVELNRRK